MAIPTIISGIYGMNVSSEGMPFANLPYGFALICGIIVVICICLLYTSVPEKGADRILWGAAPAGFPKV